MDFEILINDLFVNLATDPKLTPTANKCVLSLVNDFEDKAWRHEKFANFIWDNIALTALSAQERDKLADRSYTKLKASAQNLRLTDKADDIGEGSELAEIVLYGIMHHHYKALPVVPKIFYKQNAQDNAKGADSVHIVLDDKGDFSLWFGEAKFFNSIEDARLPEVVTSVGKSLNTKKLKKENSIITNTSDLDALLKDAELTARIKMALSDQGSIDLIKPKINIPILLLHECAITEKWLRLFEQHSPIYKWTAGGLPTVQRCPRRRSALATNRPTRWATRGAPGISSYAASFNCGRSPKYFWSGVKRSRLE